jgi:hypothetical protein
MESVALIDVSSQVFKEFNGVYVNCDHCGGPLEIHGEEASLPAFSGCFGFSSCIGCGAVSCSPAEAFPLMDRSSSPLDC